MPAVPGRDPVPGDSVTWTEATGTPQRGVLVAIRNRDYVVRPFNEATRTLGPPETVAAIAHAETPCF